MGNLKKHHTNWKDKPGEETGNKDILTTVTKIYPPSVKKKLCAQNA